MQRSGYGATQYKPYILVVLKQLLGENRHTVYS